MVWIKFFIVMFYGVWFLGFFVDGIKFYVFFFCYDLLLIIKKNIVLKCGLIIYKFYNNMWFDSDNVFL